MEVQQTQAEAQRVMVPIHPTAINTPTGLVMVWGFEHVSAKMLDVLKIMLSHDAFDTVYHGIKSVVFRIDGYPKQEDKALCASFAPDTCGVSINLEKTLEQALNRSLDHPETSIFASWWIEMILNFGHEIHHGTRWHTDRTKLHNNDELLDDEETRAEEYSNEVIVELAQEYDIELPSIEEEIWFNNQIGELFSGKDETDKWAKAQKEMITENIIWRYEPKDSAPVVISTFKDLVCLISDGEVEAEEWRKPTIKLGPNTPTLNEQLNGKTVIMNADGEQSEVIQQSPAAADIAANPVNNTYEYVDEMDGCIEGGEEEYYDDYGPQSQVSVAQPVAAKPVAAKPADYFPFNNMPSQTAVVQEESHDMATANRIVQGVYLKMFDFIFKNCMPLKKADGSIVSPKDTINPAEGIWYSDPEAVLKTPLPLTAEEAAIFVSMDHNDINGRWCPNADTSKGLLGKVMKNAGIPAYQVTLKVNGTIHKRLFLPQNPNKRNTTSGVLSGRAAELRAGGTIAYIKNADTDAWVARIENGVYVPQAQ